MSSAGTVPELILHADSTLHLSSVHSCTSNPEPDRLADGTTIPTTTPASAFTKPYLRRACDAERFYTATVYPESTDSKSLAQLAFVFIK